MCSVAKKLTLARLHFCCKMALIRKLIPLIPKLIEREFTASSEGTTNSGKHERDVATFFVENGFTSIPCIITVKPESKRAKKVKDVYVMDRTTHSPNTVDCTASDGSAGTLVPVSDAADETVAGGAKKKRPQKKRPRRAAADGSAGMLVPVSDAADETVAGGAKKKKCPQKPLDLPYDDGPYSILQPYSKTGRGAMTPAPDIYLVWVVKNRITEWLGVEAKSSKDSLCPMWNEHLPRPYIQGNILYFFSGYDKDTKKKINTIFTGEVFFKGKEFPEKELWNRVRAAMAAIVSEYKKNFSMVEFKLRQFNGQKPFTSKEMVDMVTETTAFLSTLLVDHSDSPSLSSSSTAPLTA